MTTVPSKLKEHTIDSVSELYEDKTGINISTLQSKSRERKLMIHRKVFFYLCRMLLKRTTFERIGKILGYNHSTVVHHVSSVGNWVEGFGNKNEMEVLNKFKIELKLK